MGILIDRSTRVVVQGITGRDGSFHTRQMLEYGTRVVAGVTPGKAGEQIDGVPVFDSMHDAVRQSGANTSVIYVPPKFTVDALYEAADSGVELVVCITEGVPANDMLRVVRYFQVLGVRLVGPNCPGVITPGVCKVGILPGNIHKRGSVGVVSRSGTLTYEVVSHLTNAGLGQSTCIGIGGDPIIGFRFVDALAMFEKDRQTEAIVLIGEIGGNDEEVAAEYVQRHMTKPVVAFIAGRTAPPGKRMGHAGAIIAGGAGTASDKITAFRAASVEVAESPSEVPEMVGAELKKVAKRKGARLISVGVRTRAAAKPKTTRKPRKSPRAKSAPSRSKVTRSKAPGRSRPKSKTTSRSKSPKRKSSVRKSSSTGKKKPASGGRTKSKTTRKKPASQSTRKTSTTKKPKTKTPTRRTPRKSTGKTKRKR